MAWSFAGTAPGHAGLSSLGRRLEGRPVDLGRAEALRGGDRSMHLKAHEIDTRSQTHIDIYNYEYNYEYTYT